VALDRIIRISTKVETQAKDYPEKMEISQKHNNKWDWNWNFL